MRCSLKVSWKRWNNKQLSGGQNTANYDATSRFVSNVSASFFFFLNNNRGNIEIHDVRLTNIHLENLPDKKLEPLFRQPAHILKKINQTKTFNCWQFNLQSNDVNQKLCIVFDFDIQYQIHPLFKI